MIKSGIIVTGPTGKTGGGIVAELPKDDYCVRTMVRQEDSPNVQSKRKGSLSKRFKVTVLVLLSLSTYGAFAGDVKPYNQAQVEKLPAEGKPILLDFRA